MSVKSIQSVKKHLLERESALQNRLQAATADREQAHSRDWSEQAQERENDDVLTSIGLETKAELIAVKKALARIEAGSYGICTGCHQAISPPRLAALPEAEYCIQCQAP